MAADYIVREAALAPWTELDADLATARATARRLAKVSELVKAGNRKLLQYPWRVDVIEFDDRKPSTMIRNVGWVMTNQARVEFADGHPDSAVETINTFLAFGDRVCDNEFLDALMVTPALSIMFHQVQAGLPKLSAGGARNLALAFDNITAKSPFVVREMSKRFEAHRAFVPRLLEMGPEGNFDGTAEFLKMHLDERSRYVTLIRNALTELEKRESEMFKREERFWRLNDLHYDDPLVEGVMDMFYMPVSHNATRVHTQVRLAALHCRVIEFKRSHNRWPQALAELGGRDVWYDPASGGPFFYAVLSDQSYSLYSLGTPETGRIDLVYKKGEQ